MSDTGKRCTAREHLQFDHVIPVARGGEASVSNIRLLCRAHNQHAAEQAFGAEFMRNKVKAAGEAGETPEKAEDEIDKDIIVGLRTLGFSANRARRAAESCRTMAGATLEERMRAALSCFRPRGSLVVRAPAMSTAAPCTP